MEREILKCFSNQKDINMDNRHIEQQKKLLFSSHEKTDFEREAREGWGEIGEERWDSIHNKLESRIDALTEPKHVEINSPRGWRKVYFIAAAVAVLLAIGVGMQLMDQDFSKDNTKLFNEYYKPLSGPEDVFRSGNAAESDNAKAIDASDAYDDLDYSRAIALYTELLNENPKSSKYILFLGLSFINDGRYEDAITLYNGHNSTNSKYDDDIQWYLALAHLSKGEVHTSRRLLEMISMDEDSYYQETASELSRRLAELD